MGRHLHRRRRRRQVRADHAPAKRACGVGVEPHIDALQVEAMVALGEQPGLLPFGELAETNRALKPLLELRRSEGDDGEGMENGDVQSSAGGGGVVAVGVEHEAPAAGACFAVPAPEPLSVEVEEDDEDDGDEEDDDGRHHHLPCP